MSDKDEKRAAFKRVEVLIFSLGVNIHTQVQQRYGLDVFQVQEVIHTPPVTRLPRSPEGVVGMVSLRGAIIPVLDLGILLNLPTESSKSIMVVAEVSDRPLAFLVDAVDTIVRLEGADLREPPAMLQGSHLTAIAELSDGRLIQLLDMPRALESWFPAEAEGWADKLAREAAMAAESEKPVDPRNTELAPLFS